MSEGTPNIGNDQGTKPPSSEPVKSDSCGLDKVPHVPESPAPEPGASAVDSTTPLTPAGAPVRPKRTKKPPQVPENAEPLPPEFRNIKHSKKRAFLNALRVNGNISWAAKQAGVSRDIHYWWVKKDQEYANAVERAKDMAVDVLELKAWSRAVQGWEEPVYNKGVLVGHVKKSSEVLLMFLLNGARPEKYKYRTQHEHTGPNGQPLPPNQVNVNVQFDLTKLSDDELEGLRGTLAKLHGRGSVLAESGSGNGQTVSN